MDREFLDLYNRELELLYEQAEQFGEAFPGIAERLGGLVRDRVDPMISGLLEGAAFLAARVQLKIKHEFPEFTSNLLERLAPHYLAPTPSAILAQITPTFGDDALRTGKPISRGTIMEATYVQRGKRRACRYTLASPVVHWPLEITGAEYYAAPAPLQALGANIDRRALAGLRLSLRVRSKPNPDDEPDDAAARTKPETHIAGLKLKTLPIHFIGAEPDAHLLYEHIHARCIDLQVRMVDEFGDPTVVALGQEAISQIGFDDDEALLPIDKRLFRGFDLLREYFMFTRKFLGLVLTGLEKVVPRLPVRAIDLIFVFDEVSPRLASAIDQKSFALHCAPAVNLFEMSTDRIPVMDNRHEHHVVPDRGHTLEYEVHRIVEVFAHYQGVREKLPVAPLYSASMEARKDTNLFYTARRKPRLRTAEERLHGATSDYAGGEVFLTLSEPASREDKPRIAELSVRALCSNRHLAEQLPVGDGGADFRLPDDMAISVRCIAGPTPPRDPLSGYLRSRSETAHAGEVTWRLVNLLSLNHLGLIEAGAGKDGRALREALALFADLTDAATERRIRGVRSVDSRPVVRRVRHRAGLGAARGTEVTLTLDDKAYEGSSAFLLGAVIDRFLAAYVGMNHFTQTVVRTVERGEIMRWPPRTGLRSPL
jgi:type VI secretion system protein ImpG